MAKFQATNRRVNKIIILGASFLTGNLGVSALAWSTVHLLKQYWPEAQVSILGARDIQEERIEISGVPVNIVTYPVRYCRNIFIKNHIWKLFFGIVWRRIATFSLPNARYQNRGFDDRLNFFKEKTTLQALLNADLICDITGGDSFSDIYGMVRFIKGYLLKRTCQITGKPFIMLPQTFGPFKSQLSRRMAREVLKSTHKIFSRDKEGLNVIESLIGSSGKVALCPDVAFTLKPSVPVSKRKPSTVSNVDAEFPDYQLNSEDTQLIGLNVSGLLYFGGYTGKNEFGLKVDYVKLIREIINYFHALNDTKILLVPHVVPEDGGGENDLLACRKLREDLPEKLRQKVLIIEADEGMPFFDQCEVKYLIGQCDMFLGSRMHATIAAISQCIPTVGLAYSKKFAGVYATVGIEDCVADLRKHTNEEIMSIIESIYNNKAIINKRLEKIIPKTKEQIYSIFQDI